VKVAGRIGLGMGAVGESSPDAAAAMIAVVLSGASMPVTPVEVMGGEAVVITGGSGEFDGSGLTGLGAGGIAGHSPVVPGGFADGVVRSGSGGGEMAACGVGEGEFGVDVDGPNVVTPGDRGLPLVGLAGGVAPEGMIGDTCGDWLSTGILPMSVIEMCHDDRSELGLAEVERAASLPGSTDVTRR
jgi:hypothetical protein